MMTDLPTNQTFWRRWFSADQLKFTPNHCAAFLFRTLLPNKTGVDYYLRYFAACSRLATAKDAQFKLLILFHTYWSLLQGVLYLLPLEGVSPLLRLVLVDGVFILRLDRRQFYLFYSAFIAYSVHLHLALYCSPSSHKLNSIVKRALVGGSAADTRLPADVKFACFETAARQAKYRRLAMAFTNAMQGFILLLDLCLAMFVVVLASRLQSTLQPFSGLSIFTLIALFPVFLLHFLFLFLFWVSFARNFLLLATFSFVSFLYVTMLFQQNYLRLKRAFKLVYKPTVNVCSQLYLISALKQNLHIFLVTFINDAFLGPLFTVYLAFNLPVSSYFIIQLVFGKMKGLMRVIMISEIVEAFVGGLIFHLCVAVFSNFAHKGGKMLLSFAARESIQNKKLPFNLKHHLYTHIQRLVVRKKYGITYYGKFSY